MALTFKQSNSGSSGSIAFTFGLAYSSNTTAGSYLIMSLQVTNVGHTISVADNINGAWTKIVANDSLASEDFQIWHMPVNAGGAVTVTVTTTLGTAGIILIVLGEYTGQLTGSSPLDSNTTISQQAAPTATYGPLATNVANDELIWIGFTGANITWTNASYNSRINGNNTPGAVLFDSGTIAATTGSYSFVATAASSALFGALVAIKSATGGGGGSNTSWLTVNLANSLRGVRH